MPLPTEPTIGNSFYLTRKSQRIEQETTIITKTNPGNTIPRLGRESPTECPTMEVRDTRPGIWYLVKHSELVNI